MTTVFVAYHERCAAPLAQLRRDLPGPRSGFALLHRQALASGVRAPASRRRMALAGLEPFAPAPGTAA